MRFSGKLDALADTVAAASAIDVEALSKRLYESRNRAAIAIGSGGSAVAAEYLALARSTVGRGLTLVQTPLAFTLGLSHLHDIDAWLFSAGGDNHDILSALTTARHRGARSVTIVTANPSAQLIDAAHRLPDSVTLVTPRAEPKDGFLATHSLIGAVVALLRAADQAANNKEIVELAERVTSAARSRLAHGARHALRDALADAAAVETIVLLHDPRLSAASVLIDTSLWEAAICSIQRTDFRNFAHGRHVWLAKRPAESFVIGLTGQETQPIWKQVADHLPRDIKRHSLDYGGCSRFDGYLAILDAFAIVESLGNFQDIDPGKPGVGDFAPPIYDADSLGRLSHDFTPPVRQKRFICARHDEIGTSVSDLPAAYRNALERLGTASFGGLVLDYDGTVVSSENRYHPPRPEMVEQLIRLLNDGLHLGIATGRGGSAGEDLRKVLPEEHHHGIVMGYYNGAHIAPLSQDIRDAPPPPNEAVQRAVEWTLTRSDLFDHEFKNSGVQATLDEKYIRSPDSFIAEFRTARFEGFDRLKLVKSGHSFDICPVEACKTNVVNAVQEALPESQHVLCVGDSGGATGNDHIMLGLPFGISVDHVCSREQVGWSLFGTECTGPDALMRILSAMTPKREGGFAVQTALLVDN